MYRRIGELAGYTIQATDGELGRVDEVYFDDRGWTVRYLVVKTGGWLFGRRVLLSPVSLGIADRARRVFPVQLTQDQVRRSPALDTDLPVWRQHLFEVQQYNAWPFNWDGLAGLPIAVVRPHGDPHLRSTRHVAGYRMQAKDGEVGRVEDFLLDDMHWEIRYLMIGSGSLGSGTKVMLPTMRVTRVSWEKNKVFTPLAGETIRNSPALDLARGVTEDYVREVERWYGRFGDC